MDKTKNLVSDTNTKPFYKKWWFILIVVIIISNFISGVINPKPDPCDCMNPLMAFSSPPYGTDDAFFDKWQRCRDAYYGYATAVLACNEKNKN